MTLSRLVKAALVAAAASLPLSGCMVSAGPAARPAVYQPEPVYFDGFLVHFDSVGPYVYVGSAPRYIPRSHPRYREIVRHAPHHGPRYASRRDRYQRYDRGDRYGHDRDDRYGRRDRDRYERRHGRY